MFVNDPLLTYDGMEISIAESLIFHGPLILQNLGVTHHGVVL